jgi:hypothetical protein
MSCCKWQQGNVPGLLDCTRQTALVRGAYSSKTTRYDLAALGHKSLQQANIAVRNRVNLFCAELTDLLAAKELATAARAALWASARAWCRAAGPRSGLWCRCRCARFERLSSGLFRHDVPSLLSSLPVPLKGRKNAVSSCRRRSSKTDADCGNLWTVSKRQPEQALLSQLEQPALRVRGLRALQDSLCGVHRAGPSPWRGVSLLRRCVR